MDNVNRNDAEFDSLLIEGVRKNKCLYDKRDAFYFNKLKKEKAWKAIGEESNRTASECRSRWKALRERYLRELRKQNQPSGSGAYDGCVWELMEELNFLKDSMQPRMTISNETGESFDTEAAQLFSDDGAAAATTEEVSTGTASKKRKTAFDGLCEKFGVIVEKLEGNFVAPVSNDDDGDEEFLASILAMMRVLPPDTKDAYKAEMLTRVNQLRRQHRSFGSV